MSSDYFNIRFGIYHLKVTRGRYWCLPYLERNDYHKGRNTPWFEVYCLFGNHIF